MRSPVIWCGRFGECGARSSTPRLSRESIGRNSGRSLVRQCRIPVWVKLRCRLLADDWPLRGRNRTWDRRPRWSRRCHEQNHALQQTVLSLVTMMATPRQTRSLANMRSRSKCPSAQPRLASTGFRRSTIPNDARLDNCNPVCVEEIDLIAGYNDGVALAVAPQRRPFAAELAALDLP